MSTDVAIVGCGKSKRDYRSKARNLYTSAYFDKKRQFAEIACDDWFVLSAKYGLIDPDCPIDPYDVTIGDVSKPEFNRKVSDQAERHASTFDDADRVFVLAGNDYIRAIDGVLDSISSTVAFPFADTSGIGDQMAVLKERMPNRTPIDYRSETAYRACVRIFSAGGGGPTDRYYWPYKLLHAGNAKRAEDVYAERLIVDSDISNPGATNQDVLDAAERVDADIVVPKDYLHDRASTTESVREFRDLYDDHEFDGRYLIPLQPPHHIHAKDFPDESGFVLGGIKDADPAEQIRHIRKTRDAVGDDAYLHALGMGASRRLIDTFRINPTLLDSLDCKTPEFAPTRHRTPDMNMKARDGGFELPGGDGTSTGKAIAAELILWQMAHMLNPDWRGDEDASPGIQSGVDQFV